MEPRNHGTAPPFPDPGHLRSVAGLELLARLTVDSVLPGLNRSRRSGAGMTFSQYRSYQPGDDPRRLDWKLYARSDRFFVREAELETNITVQFLLDASNSMRHEDANGLTKLDYARYLIACLAWLAQGQGDTLALYAVNERQSVRIDPRPGQHYFQRFLHGLLRVDAGGRFPATGNAGALLPAAARGRELLIFLTDLYEQEAELSETLRQLSRTGHEVLLFHLMAGNELDLSYGKAGAFEDLETGRRLQVDPDRARSAYQARLAEYLRDTERRMLDWRIAYQRFRTDEPAGEALRAFLQKRINLL